MLRHLYLLAALFAIPALAAPPVFYVSPMGDDSYNGLNFGHADALKGAVNTNGPFATLTRARDALRAAGLAEGGTVYVVGGDHYLAETLLLEEQDSGTPENPVIWQVFDDRPVYLHGGKRIDPTAFTPYRDVIQKADISALKLTTQATQIMLNGERQVLARWPNKGEGDLPGGGWAFVAAQNKDDAKKSFRYDGDGPAAFAGKQGLEISIWPNYNWWQTIVGVEKIDPATKLIQLPSDLPYTIEPGRRYFLQNSLDMLDAPGEWYHDLATQTLYLWPPEPLSANTPVVVPTAQSVISAKGLKHAVFIGLNIESSAGDGVVLKDCEDVLFARAAVRNTYGFGIVVDGGQSVRIRGNDIYATGKGGITLGGGDRKTLTPGNNEAVNNHIHHYAQIFNTYNCGVNISGVGNRIQHNSIHDAPHIGILLGGNDHLIEYNDIHHVCMEGADNGGFYMGRDWTQRGNVIRYNKFHDIYGFGLGNLATSKDGTYRYEAPHQAWGVYLDDCSSGTEIYGNLFYRVPLAGVMIGGGRDNKVYNNVFAECTPALHIDDRWDSYPWDLMKERLEAMNYEHPPFSERYPELLAMGDDPRTPANNRFERNVVYYTRDEFRGLSTTAPSSGKAIMYDLAGFDPKTTVIQNNLIDLGRIPPRVYWRAYEDSKDAGDLDWEQWRKKGFDEGSLLLEAEFVDPEHDDYRVKFGVKWPRRLSFERIPIDQIGLYQDEFRATWPVPADTRRDGVEHREWTITVTP